LPLSPITCDVFFKGKEGLDSLGAMVICPGSVGDLRVRQTSTPQAWPSRYERTQGSRLRWLLMGAKTPPLRWS